MELVWEQNYIVLYSLSQGNKHDHSRCLLTYPLKQVSSASQQQLILAEQKDGHSTYN